MPHDDHVTLPGFPTLTSLPAPDHPELLAAPVAAALAGWPGADEVAVVDIDPDLADTAAMSEAYDIPMTAIATALEADLLQHVGRTDLPTAVQPVDGLLY